MQVTSQNFDQAYQIISKISQNTWFISFDLQFTGITCGYHDISAFPYQTYQNLKQVAERYRIMQIGLTFFVRQVSHYQSYSFNFFVFPFSSPFVTMETACLKFISDKGLDWNKWIRLGLSYMRMCEMDTYYNQSSDDYMASLDEKYQIKLEEIISFVLDVNEGKELSPFIIVVKRKQLPMNITKTFFHKYIDQNKLAISFLVDVKSSTNDYVLKFFRIKQNERQKEHKRRQIEEFGFTLVFRHIWNSSIYLIGHNCFLDLLYLYDALVQPLPSSYFDFKQKITQLQVKFIDTKYLSTQLRSKLGNRTKIEQLIKYFLQNRSKETVVPQKDYSYDLRKDGQHQAGFDSFATGWIYVQISLMQNIYSNYSNKLKINNSFYNLDFNEVQDQIEFEYRNNLLVYLYPIKYYHQQSKKIYAQRLQTYFENKNVKQNLKIIRSNQKCFILVKQNKQKIIQEIFLFMKQSNEGQFVTFNEFLRREKQRIKYMISRDYESKQLESISKQMQNTNYFTDSQEQEFQQENIQTF